MAKVSAVLRTSKTDAAGQHPVWLRLSDTHRTLYLALGVSVAPRHWNPNDPRRPVRKSHPHADQINGLVSARLASAEAERLRRLTAGEPATAEGIKAALSAKPAEASDPCFLGYVEAFLVGVEKAGNVARRLRRGRVASVTSRPLP